MKSYKVLASIAILACLAVLTGCRGSRVARTVELHDTVRIESERIETVRIDTVAVTVKLPAERVEVIKTGDEVSEIETSLARSRAWINRDGTLGHTIENKIGTIADEVLVPVKETVDKSSNETVREKPVPYPVEVERELTGWQKLRLDAFPWLLALIGLYIFLRYKRYIR